MPAYQVATIARRALTHGDPAVIKNICERKMNANTADDHYNYNYGTGLGRISNVTYYPSNAASTITYTPPTVAKITEKTFVLVDLDTGAIIGSAYSEAEADEQAAGICGRTDHRILVLRPIFVQSPKKETVRKAITL